MAGQAGSQQKRTSSKYWENEKPTVVATGSRLLTHYPNAGKLQISQAYLGDKGEKLPGKTVTLDAEDIGLCPDAIKLIALFLKDAKNISSTDSAPPAKPAE